MTLTRPGHAVPPGAPAGDQVARTWRDLPDAPPYGPVPPPRHPDQGQAFAAPLLVQPDAAITPGQIALAVGGTLLLVALGIGAALLLLGGEDDIASTAAVATEDVAAPLPVDPVPVDPVPIEPQPRPDAPQGELDPQPPGGDTPPNGGLQPEDDRQAAPGGPRGQGDPQQPQDDPAGGSDEELPRLFRLRTLPAGTEEEATTIRQTTREDERLTEQVTTLVSDEGEIAVRAIRAGDADERLAAQITDEAQEVSVRGTPAWLIDGQRLVLLLPGDVETLVEVDAPPAVGTEALLTIAQGMELL